MVHTAQGFLPESEAKAKGLKPSKLSGTEFRRLLRAGEVRSLKLGPQERRIPMGEVRAYVDRLVAEQIGASTSEAPRAS